MILDYFLCIKCFLLSSISEEEFTRLLDSIGPSYYLSLAILLAPNLAEVCSFRNKDITSIRTSLLGSFNEWNTRHGNTSRIKLAEGLRTIGLNAHANQILEHTTKRA